MCRQAAKQQNAENHAREKQQKPESKADDKANSLS